MSFEEMLEAPYHQEPDAALRFGPPWTVVIVDSVERAEAMYAEWFGPGSGGAYEQAYNGIPRLTLPYGKTEERFYKCALHAPGHLAHRLWAHCFLNRLPCDSVGACNTHNPCLQIDRRRDDSVDEDLERGVAVHGGTVSPHLHREQPHGRLLRNRSSMDEAAD